MSKIVRTPVIPGFNDSPEDISKIADFIRPFPRVIFELLPYHRFGEPKYRFLDKSYLLPDRVPPDANRMTRAQGSCWKPIIYIRIISSVFDLRAQVEM